ncbi:hypothetical protein E4U58_004674 [Claviceps cyperi]|nr:hypothetical protein E4U58_004674 [Claviceps cyperi]
MDLDATPPPTVEGPAPTHSSTSSSSSTSLSTPQPELAYQEVHAHDTLSDSMEARGYPVGRKAYGLDTSFQGATAALDGRLVIVCAEYDALPTLGHGCGHNLVATASLGAFLGAAHVLSQL